MCCRNEWNKSVPCLDPLEVKWLAFDVGVHCHSLCVVQLCEHLHAVSSMPCSRKTFHTLWCSIVSNALSKKPKKVLRSAPMQDHVAFHLNQTTFLVETAGPSRPWCLCGIPLCMVPPMGRYFGMQVVMTSSKSGIWNSGCCRRSGSGTYLVLVLVPFNCEHKRANVVGLAVHPLLWDLSVQQCGVQHVP